MEAGGGAHRDLGPHFPSLGSCVVSAREGPGVGRSGRAVTDLPGIRDAPPLRAVWIHFPTKVGMCVYTYFNSLLK